MYRFLTARSRLIRNPPVKAVWRKAGRDAVLIESPYQRR